MSEEEIQRLAAAIVALTPPPIPFDKQAWNIKETAAHFDLSVHHFRKEILCLPSFPKGSPRETKRKVYDAQEVVDWRIAHKERH